MSIFPFRDSWEVWRQKVNAAIGSTDPIPASRITFDNAGTDVTATNVQDAVAEVAGDVSSVATVVGDENSGLVKDVSKLQSIVHANGVTNYLPNVGSTIETNGITFTKNSDGSVTANGTATANATYRMVGSDSSKPLALPTGKYIISGCPNDASDEKYWMVFSWTGKPTSYVYGTPIEVEVTPANPTNAGIVIKSGVTVDNVTFYPMISDIETTYVPYAASNSELTKDISDLQSEIDEKTSNCKIVSFNNTVSITGTGTETYKDLLDGVVGLLSNAISALNNNQFILVQRITLAGVITLIPKSFYYSSVSDVHILAAINLGVTDSQLVFWAYSYPEGGSVFSRATYNLSTNVATYENTGALTPASGRTISIMYDIYERIE